MSVAPSQQTQQQQLSDYGVPCGVPSPPPSFLHTLETQRVVLGSSSKWRAKVIELATGRKDMVMRADPQWRGDEWVICSDQVALCAQEMREKPETREEAMRFIRSYSSGQTVSALNAVVIAHLGTGQRVEGYHVSTVEFGQIPEEEVLDLLTDPSSSPLYTCAGGYSVDWPPMGRHVKRLEGGVDGVMGIPMGLIGELFVSILPPTLLPDMTTPNTRASAEEYLAKHRIAEVVQDLCAAAIFHQPPPDQLTDFLVQQLQRRQTEGAQGGLFDSSEIGCVFQMADLLKTGSISDAQAKTALRSLANSAKQEAAVDTLDVPAAVDREQFMDFARTVLNL